MKHRTAAALPVLFIGLAMLGQGCPLFSEGTPPPPEPTTPSQPPIESVLPDVSPGLAFNPSSLSFKHKIGLTACPTNIGTVSLKLTKLPDFAKWKAEADANARWLAYTKTGKFGDDMKLSFNCKLSSYTTQTVTGQVTVTAYGTDGTKPLATGTITITGEIKK